MAQSQGSLSHINHHISLEDDKKIRFGNDTDADIVFDGTDLVINPQRVGSGKLRLSAGSLSIIDSASLILGTGDDATIKYDGTNLLINPQVVGSGSTILSAGSLKLQVDNSAIFFGAGDDATIKYDGTDLLINPQVVGSGNLHFTAGGIELIDNASLILGTGEDVTLKYDGTRTLLDPKVAGTGEFVIKGEIAVQKMIFDTLPVIMQDDGTSASGVAGEVNVHKFDSFTLHQYNETTQTLLAPLVASTGLDYAYDLTDNDGIQWRLRKPSSKGKLNRDHFISGTSPAFFASLKFTIADVSGSDDLAFGFFKHEAFTANIDDYNDMAVLNVQLGDIFIETIKANAATTSTDTTNNWADGETHTLTIKVSAANVVTYLIDGVAPTTVASFSFTAGDVVTPGFYLRHATTNPTSVIIQELECGLQ